MDSVPETVPVGYDMQWHPTEVDVSAVLKRNCILTPAVRVKDPDSRNYFLIRLLRSGSIDEKHRANVVFTFEVVEFIREISWARGAHQSSEKQEAESKEEGLFRSRVALMYQHGLEAPFFAKRAAEVQHPR